MRIWGSILVVTVMGGLAGAYWMNRKTPHSSPMEKESAEAGPVGLVNPGAAQDIQGEVATLRAALALTQERLDHVEASKAKTGDAIPAPPSAAESTRPQQPTPEQIAEEQELQARASAEEYESRARTFDSEPREEAWAKQAEEKLSSAAEGALPEGAKIEGGSCRTSLCKYDIAFPRPEDRLAFRGEFLRTVDSEGILGYNFKTLDQRADGIYPIRVLVFRDGYSMPGLSGPQ